MPREGQVKIRQTYGGNHGRCAMCHLRTSRRSDYGYAVPRKTRSRNQGQGLQALLEKWEGMRVMVINEYQVNLGDESGRELVKKQMKAFLKLGEQTDTSKLDQNFRPAGS